MNVKLINSIVEYAFLADSYEYIAFQHDLTVKQVRNTISYVKSGRLPCNDADRLRQLRGNCMLDELKFKYLDVSLMSYELAAGSEFVSSACYGYFVDGNFITIVLTRETRHGKFRCWRAELTLHVDDLTIKSSDKQLYCSTATGPTPSYVVFAVIKKQTSYWQNVRNQLPHSAYPKQS